MPSLDAFHAKLEGHNAVIGLSVLMIAAGIVLNLRKGGEFRRCVSGGWCLDLCQEWLPKFGATGLGVGYALYVTKSKQDKTSFAGGGHFRLGKPSISSNADQLYQNWTYPIVIVTLLLFGMLFCYQSASPNEKSRKEWQN